MSGVLKNFSLCNSPSGTVASGLLLIASNDSCRLKFTGTNALHAQNAVGRRISVSGERACGVFKVSQFSVLRCS